MEFRTKPTPPLNGNRLAQLQTAVQYLLMEACSVWDYQISGLPEAAAYYLVVPENGPSTKATPRNLNVEVTMIDPMDKSPAEN